MIDLMCMNYKRAAENRERVRLKQNIAGYLEIEAIVRSWPHHKLLPSWIPLGKLPSIGTSESIASGFHIVDDLHIREFRYPKPSGDFCVPFHTDNPHGQEMGLSSIGNVFIERDNE